MAPSALDESVYCASKELRGRGAPDPDVLFFMATGVGLLPSSFDSTWQSSLETIAGVPRAWREKTLHAAESRDGATFWFLEEAPSEQEFPSSGATSGAPENWVGAFPLWLAACSGASLCVHTAAGSALEEADSPLPTGTIALTEDHINLSGKSPLFALGESRLGPLFPDQTRLHHQGLRRIALGHGERLGLKLGTGVAACTAGPAIETAAERRFFAKSGAHFSVQGLADPLIAMAHAGMGCLSLVALIGDSSAAEDVASLVQRSEDVAPSMDELLRALAPDLATVAHELREEA